jgi:hypothetical protein
MKMRAWIWLVVICGLAFTALALGAQPALAVDMRIANTYSLTAPIATANPHGVPLDSIPLFKNGQGGNNNNQGGNNNNQGNGDPVKVSEPPLAVQLGIGLLVVVLFYSYSLRSQQSRFSNH